MFLSNESAPKGQILFVVIGHLILNHCSRSKSIEKGLLLGVIIKVPYAPQRIKPKPRRKHH